MTVIDIHKRNIPEYYPTMYIDGYTPEEILNASREKMHNDIETREEENEIPKVRIISEVKTK